MNRDDDINVPNMGPAEPVTDNNFSASPKPVSTPSMKAEEGAVQETSKSGGVFQGLVSIILIIAVSALGYFGFEMHQAQQQREATFVEAQEQIEKLKGLLLQAEEGAEQSGQAIQGNVSSLEQNLRKKDKQLDSEIAKLWAIAHQKNAPLIAKQGKTLAKQDSLIKAQEKTIKSLKSTLASQNKQLKALAGLKSDNANLKKSVNAEIAKVTQLVTKLETGLQGQLQEQKEGEVSSQKALAERVAKLESKTDAALERRVSVNEQAIRAFDGTRRQLNQDLLQVKQKLNNMQLLLEQN